MTVVLQLALWVSVQECHFFGSSLRNRYAVVVGYAAGLRSSFKLQADDWLLHNSLLVLYISLQE